MGERIWTPWFIKFIHARGYFNIYTNLLHERALSVSHRDTGVNYGKTAGPDSHLIDKSSLDIDLWEMQPLKKLKWYDFCFREVLPNRVVKSSQELKPIFDSWKNEKTVALVSLYGTTQTFMRNLICHLERLNLQNYIFIGDNSEFLLDLARRGHPVIDAGQFVNEIRQYKSEDKLMNEVLVKAHLIRTCLQYGYSSWVFDENVIPLSHSILQPPEIAYDFFASKQVELFYAKDSPKSREIWSHDFLYRLAKTTISLTGTDRRFTQVALKVLNSKGVQVKMIDELSSSLKLDQNFINGSLSDGSKKMVFWSAGIDVDSIHRKLEEGGLWLIDGNSSCIAVVCHKSL
ncbi:hypothetical protein QJS04_geneDACA003613 [Acorus gramineus]|uniref:Uncharacterized protein n=1 Tax=Acorus gramineus TaxID=55184 RepID=A0AAV9BKF2_ACOGR|nr:hypothetical protein QJS04_geneDACA003613 [Acorus gramineus]